jgi:hypothetical protein
MRPWKYREDRGNLKFKFVRSSPQKNDFQMQHLRAQLGAGGNTLAKESLMHHKPLPRLTPNPNQPKASGSGMILKSALQEASSSQQRSSSGFSKPPAPGSGVVFVCRRCNVVIQGKLNYIEHMKEHGPGTSAREDGSITRGSAGQYVSGSPQKFGGMTKFGKSYDEVRDKPFLCRECGQRFGQKVELFKHQLTHKNSEVCRCTICGKICSSIGFLSRHYQYVHPDAHNPAEEARFKSPERPTKDQSSQEHNTEANGKKEEVKESSSDEEGDPEIAPNTRPNCKDKKKQGYTNSSSDDVDDDDEGEREDVRGRLTFPYNLARNGLDVLEVPAPCEICGKEFTSRKSRSDHIYYCKKKRAFRCPVKECRHSFLLKSDFSLHVIMHMEERRFSCNFCPLRFFRKQALHRHVRVVHKRTVDSFAFPCDFCDMHFMALIKYSNHLNLTHGLDPMDISKIIHNESYNSDRGFDTEFYGEEEADPLQTEGLYSGDMEEDEDYGPDPTSFLEQSMMAADDNQYECKLCNKFFPDRQKFMFHKYYHEREAKYPCPECDEKFKLRSHLERHIMTYHNPVKPLERIYRCQLCPRKFTREHDLVGHMSKEHASESVPTASTSENFPTSILKTTLAAGKIEESAEESQPGTSTSTAAQKQSDSPTPQPQETISEVIDLAEESDQHDDGDHSPGKGDDNGSATKSSKEEGVTATANGLFKCDLCGKLFDDKKAADVSCLLLFPFISSVVEFL